MDVLKSKSQARIEENEKLSLFYQHELQQQLEKFDRQRIKWEEKRNNLSLRCLKLQESVKNKWSKTNDKLKIEKQKYCNIIIKLLPEWQKVIERKQMKQISQFESKVSLIQQRRHIADIAFEKEKKLLSLISIRQKEIERLQEEEKKDALIRQHERILIIKNEKEYNQQRKLNQTQSFANIRLQQHMIRKEVTSELEKKYSQKLDQIKDKLLNKKQVNKENETETVDVDIVSMDIVSMDIEEEKNQEINISKVEEEGIETQASTLMDIEDTSKIERAVGLIEIYHGQNQDQNKDISMTPKQTTESRLKQKFRNKTSKNRLQFSLLAGSPKKDNDTNDNQISFKSNLGLNVTINDNDNDKLKIETVDDFEDDKDNHQNNVINNGVSDDDEFDF